MRSKKIIFIILFIQTFSLAFSLSINDYWQIRDDVVAAKNWTKGISEFKKAVKEYPDELNFHLNLNWFLRENKQFEEAYQQIEEVYKKFPGNQDVKNYYKWTLQSLGWQRDGAGDKQGAFTVFKKAYELDPADEWNINNYGYILRDTGNQEEAIEILYAGTKSFPGNQYIRENYVNSLLSLGWKYDAIDKKQALLYFKKAYDFDSSYVWAINAYGYILREFMEYVESIKVLEKGLTIHKDHSYLKNAIIYSYIDYANSFRDAGDPDKAKPFYEKAAGIDSSNEAYLIHYGIFLRTTKEFKAALEIFRKGKKLYPNNIYFDSNITATYYDYGKDLLEKGKQADAVKIFREAADAFPQEFYFRYYLVVSYIKMENYIAAASEIVKMSEIKTRKKDENQDTYEMEIYHRANEVINIYSREKKFAECFTFLAGIKKAFHHPYLFLQMKGVLTYHSGNTKDGLDIVYQAYDSYISMHPEHAKPVICDLPLKGVYIVGGNSRRDAITHAGMNRYCYDFWGSDEKGNIKNNDMAGLGENADYIGFGNLIYSPVDGVVGSVVNDKDDLKPAPFYKLLEGNSIEITDAAGLHYFIVHNKKFSAKIKTGDIVKKGDVIAELGNSGMTTVPHLHFGVYTPDYIVTLPVQFAEYELINKDLGKVRKKNSIPLNNEIIKAE